MTPETDTTDATDRDAIRKRDPEATRKAILDAAAELFVTIGPGDTPTSRIARQAGVTKSLIHHHFGSKEELWDEVKRRHFGRYFEAQRALLESTRGTAELLRDSLVAYFRFLQSDPASVRFMSWRFVEGDDVCLAQEQDLFDLGAKRIEEAQAAGELRADVEPLHMIKAFLALALHWFQTKHLFCQMHGVGKDPEALDEAYLADIAKIFADGITAGCAPATLAREP